MQKKPENLGNLSALCQEFWILDFIITGLALRLPLKKRRNIFPAVL